MPRPAGLLIDWTDVIEVAKTEKDLRRLEIYSFDLAAVASILPGATNDQYTVAIDGEQALAIWDDGNTEADLATKLILEFNTNRIIYRKAHAQGYQENQIDRKGANFPEELEIMAVDCWAVLAITKSTNVILSEGIDGEPLRLGGRSRVMEYAAQWIKSDYYGDWTKTAQTLFAAHRATMFAGPAAGQGTKASESYEGESMAWTMPTNNPTAEQELLVTNYGKILNEIKRKVKKQKSINYKFMVCR